MGDGEGVGVGVGVGDGVGVGVGESEGVGDTVGQFWRHKGGIWMLEPVMTPASTVEPAKMKVSEKGV